MGNPFIPSSFLSQFPFFLSLVCILSGMLEVLLLRSSNICLASLRNLVEVRVYFTGLLSNFWDTVRLYIIYSRGLTIPLPLLLVF